MSAQDQRRARCEIKHRYRSHDEATRKNPTRPAEYCNLCRGWHVGREVRR